MHSLFGSGVQDSLVIDTNAPIARVGARINLSTSGGSGGGAVSYLIVGITGSGMITGNVLIVPKEATSLVSAVKKGDQNYA